MYTCRQLITRSLRMLGVIGEGNPAPTAAQGDDGLNALIALYNGLIGTGTFGPLKDVLITENYTAKENERVIDATGLLTVTLPLTVDVTLCDGEPYDPTCDTTRPVQDRSIVLQLGGTPKASIFDGDLNAWTDVNALTLDSTAPLSGRFGTGLCAILAQNIAPEYGLEAPPQILGLADAGHAALKLKKPRRVWAEMPVLRTLGHRHWYGR
jgi:hypothetical protein